MEETFVRELPKFLIILTAAIIAGEIFVRFGQSQSLGYLTAGILLGPALFNFFPQDDSAISFFATLGLVFLLFEVGLETDFSKLKKEGLRALTVAVIGVSLPLLFGWLAIFLWFHDYLLALFMGATMTATSVGITVAVLAELKKLNSAEGRIILGAAVLDDIIGLVLLSVVLGIAEGKTVSFLEISHILGLALLFLGVAFFAGRRFAPWFIKWVRRMKSSGFLETSVFLLCLVVAWIASEIGLALIVGAFIAGLMLESVEEREHILVSMDFLKNAFLPLFFVSAGALFNPLAIGNVESAILLAFISVIAVTGKMVSGFGARGLCLRSMILIGSGMIPRGEVGLIFAASGRLVGVFDERMYGVALGMVMVTTFIAPIVLKPLAKRNDSGTSAIT